MVHNDNNQEELWLGLRCCPDRGGGSVSRSGLKIYNADFMQTLTPRTHYSMRLLAGITVGQWRWAAHSSLARVQALDPFPGPRSNILGFYSEPRSGHCNKNVDNFVPIDAAASRDSNVSPSQSNVSHANLEQERLKTQSPFSQRSLRRSSAPQTHSVTSGSFISLSEQLHDNSTPASPSLLGSLSPPEPRVLNRNNHQTSLDQNQQPFSEACFVLLVRSNVSRYQVSL